MRAGKNGLTMLNNLNHYLEIWHLSEPRLLAQTATSHVYTVTVDGMIAVLKVFTPYGADEKTGAIALRHFDGHGAVRLLRNDDEAHLLEYIEGQDLIPLVRQGEDEQATAIIGDVLNQLHAAPLQSSPDGLMPLNIRFRSLFKKAGYDRQNGLDSIFTRAAVTTEKLLSNPGTSYVLHGDIHHENIRYSAERGWLAIDPKGLFGERTYDTANTLCNPFKVSKLVHNEMRLLKNAAILSQKLGIELPRILAFTFAYACLSASWTLEDGHDASYALKVAEIVEPHVLIKPSF